jgi:meso-butanediol dehydrogenase/(S,S)-butanediol dehydrogenase/diacetyl reductase
MTSPIALVTGAGQGIGRAIALRLAEDGFDIAVNDLAEDERTSETLSLVRATGQRAIFVPADVSDEVEVNEMVERCIAQLGDLHVAVANAGMARAQLLTDTTVEEWDRLFAVNVRGVFLTFRAAARHFIYRGGGGKLIGASSQAGHRGASMLAAYSATKFAVRGLTQAAAREWASHGITVNSYAPGVVETPMWNNTDREFAELTGRAPGETFREFAGEAPLGRPQTAGDVAGLVSFLASSDSDYMTGQTLLMDGGSVTN